LSALRQLAPGRLNFALAFGMMSQQGRELSQAQIADIVGYLKGTAPQPQPVLPDSSCHDAGPALNDATLPRWNGWGVDIRQHRFQPADQAQLAADDVPRLKLRWAFAFPGDIKAYAQPTVYGDGYSSAAPAARSMRSMPKPAASAGCSTQASACAAPSPSARTRAG
jgi:polyvinyl alcohol dehydrogenase (cytochrome)